MATHMTMMEAFEQAAEEIQFFQAETKFPPELTHHEGRDIPRFMSHGGNYDDKGNWTGSILMHVLLFHFHLRGIFDVTGQRAAVYSYWGSEYQRSGKGPDNDRTNLLEAILAVMGSEGIRTQRAWLLVRRYAMKHPNLTRQSLLQQALTDGDTCIYIEEDAIAQALMKESDRDWDDEACVKLSWLFPFVLQTSRVPDYPMICEVTGCSPKNNVLKQIYWNALARYLELYVQCA